MLSLAASVALMLIFQDQTQLNIWQREFVMLSLKVRMQQTMGTTHS